MAEVFDEIGKNLPEIGINTNIYTVEEATQEILRLLKKGGTV